MNKAKLILLGCPIVLASMLLVTNTAQATEVVVKTPNPVESASGTEIFEVEFVAQIPANPTSELINDCKIVSIQLSKFIDYLYKTDIRKRI